MSLQMVQHVFRNLVGWNVFTNGFRKLYKTWQRLMFVYPYYKDLSSYSKFLYPSAYLVFSSVNKGLFAHMTQPFFPPFSFFSKSAFTISVRLALSPKGWFFALSNMEVMCVGTLPSSLACMNMLSLYGFLLPIFSRAFFFVDRSCPLSPVQAAATLKTLGHCKHLAGKLKLC